MKKSKPVNNSPKLFNIRKRDGTLVPFIEEKIATAVQRAMFASKEYRGGAPEKISIAITKVLLEQKEENRTFVPTVEGVQDLVESELMLHKFPATAKAYILYRAERSKLRDERGVVSERVRMLAKQSSEYFKDNPLGEFVYLRTYARWIKDEGRRETWIETVDRYISFMKENVGNKLSEDEYREVREAILKQEIMPSMRLMQFSGEPARRCNTCAYNCSFIAPSKLGDFAEIMYLSMQGCGVGFSVESQNIEQMPQIQKQINKKLPTHVIKDSKEGWCDALTLGLKTWYGGKDTDFDYSLIRPAGARLKTMGGKASGPEPLRSLLQFAREKILRRQGRRLRSIDVHDIICKIGECVVSGGVRRTAMISLSDLDDPELRDAKKGQFFITEPHRSVANNSAVYENKPTNTELVEEWVALMKSGSGERGIFNRGTLGNTLPERRLKYFKKMGFLGKDGVVQGSIGTNPCGEIILQSKQFCNLSEVIARAGDTKETLIRKAKLAALLGTYQSMLTNFNYISKDWGKHCQDERLLGVSVTGQWDSDEARKPEVLRAMRDTAITANAEYAKRFDISTSLAVTAVKPSGTVSQTFNCSSGIHPRHSKYYIRRIRISATDSLFKMLKDQGMPYHPEVGQLDDSATTYVLEFPVASPGKSVFKDGQSALEQLEYWKVVKLNFTEHNPSATISVGENEWISVVDWLQKNWEIIGGLSFLPRFDHVYRLAPYEEIDEKRYKELFSKLPYIDYSKLVTYEHSDETEQKKEYACVGGVCDIDMIVPTDNVTINS
ncbi:MAG: ATP cone domain-containing protein [Candidatus Zambryskibacteria bacterium]|nr:ATP cone domain-containing protein [Candidatus Zambryskibacteria bacterium]